MTVIRMSSSISGAGLILMPGKLVMLMLPGVRTRAADLGLAGWAQGQHLGVPEAGYRTPELDMGLPGAEYQAPDLGLGLPESEDV